MWQPYSILSSLSLLSVLPSVVLGGDVLQTNGWSSCGGSADIEVQKMNVQFDRSAQKITFDVGGTSTKQQNVTASLTFYAYGKQVYQKEFNPCDSASKVEQLCPVPKGTFAAAGSQDIPSKYADMIPAIAFNVPDLDGVGKLELKNLDTGNNIACIESVVDNGKSASIRAVPVIAASICGAALVVSGLGAALGASGGVGSAAPSPSFTEVFGWFQGMAMNGMLSVNYPSVYRSFTKNFAFSTGLVPWDGMETAIDNFRRVTGGDLTNNSVVYLRNATLVYQGTTNITKRDLPTMNLLARELAVSANSTVSPGNSTSDSKTMHAVHGIAAFAEQLAIPRANTFMTVLLIFGIVIGAIIVGILLFKVILEAWALFGKFPRGLTSFRKRYWWVMAKTITNLILLLYGVWTLYCVYQFTQGDSWAAKTLAGVTLAIFTAVLGYFTFCIWRLANAYKKSEGDANKLFENKETWRKYSIFYENYKKSYWWLFVPTIVYMFAKGVIIAAGDGHGIVQTAGQLIVESLMLVLLLWSRPYTLKSGNWINIIIQVVRVLSVLCILIFVEQLGIAQSTKTITGVVLIVMQSVLTGVLAILIAVNAIIVFFRANPHRKARKEAEKFNRDLDDLAPADARNSLLIEPGHRDRKSTAFAHSRETSQDSGHYRDNKPYSDEEAGAAAAHKRKTSVTVTARNASPNPSVRAPLLPEINTKWRQSS